MSKIPEGYERLGDTDVCVPKGANDPVVLHISRKPQSSEPHTDKVRFNTNSIPDFGEKPALFTGREAQLLLGALEGVERHRDAPAKPILLEHLKRALDEHVMLDRDSARPIVQADIEEMSDKEFTEEFGNISVEDAVLNTIESTVSYSQADSLCLQNLHGRVTQMSDDEAEIVMRKYERQRDGFAWKIQELHNKSLDWYPTRYPYIKFVTNAFGFKGITFS